MAITISKLSVLLEGNVGGLTSSLQAGERAVAGFESTVEHVGGHIGGILAGLGVGLSLEGIGEYLKGTFEAITSTARLSDSLGIATESLGRMNYAAKLAGVSSEDLDTGLKKMLKGIYDATTGTGTAGKAFEALGLDAKELAAMKPEEAFAKIGDKLKDIQNPAERAGATMEIFGRNGATLLPILTQGSEKLAEVGAEADKMGLSLSRVDAAKVELAHESIAKLQGTIEGAANALVVHMAPYIEAVADKLTSFGEAGDGMSKLVVSGFESVVKAVAYATDLLHVAKGGWDYLAAGATFAMYGVVKGIDAVLHGINFLYEKLGKEKIDTTFLDQYTDGLLADAKKLGSEGTEEFKKAFDGDNFKAASRYFADLERHSQSAAEQIAKDASHMGGSFEDLGESAKNIEAATKKLNELQKQVEEFGKSKGQQAADDIAATGGTAAQQAQAKALADQLDALEAQKKAQDELASDAKKMWEETRTPAEKYADSVDKINKLLAAGKIDQETADRELAKAAADMDKAGEKKHEGPKLLEAGSQEAAKFVAEIQQRQKDAKHQEELVAEAKKQTELQKKMADALGGGGEENEFVGVNIV